MAPEYIGLHTVAHVQQRLAVRRRNQKRIVVPREERLARVADALLDDVGDDRTLDDWAYVAGVSRRTFMRAFSAQADMSFGRWRQQARLFAALEMLAQRKSVTEVAIAVGYDSVSAFIEMFRTMLGTTPQTYFQGRRLPRGYEWTQRRAFLIAVRDSARREVVAPKNL